MFVQVLVVVIAANVSQRSPAWTPSHRALFAVPLATWAACRDLDALVRRLSRNGLLGGLLRATVGAGFIAGMPLLFATLEAAAAPAAVAGARTLATLLPLAVAAGLVLVGIGVADVLYTLTAGFRHLSTRLMLLLLASSLGVVIWLSYAGPEGSQLLLWAVQRGHLEAWLAPLRVVEEQAGSHVGGIAGALVLQLPFILLLAWRFGRNATDALTDLGRAFQRVGRGDLDQPVPVHGRDEVAVMKVGFTECWSWPASAGSSRPRSYATVGAMDRLTIAAAR